LIAYLLKPDEENMSLSVALGENSSSENLSYNAIGLTIEKSALFKALGHVQSVVDKRGSMPILSNVKLEALGNILTLTTTDLDIAISEKVPANVTQDGALTVPVSTFYDIVRKLPDGAQIQLFTDEQDLGRLNIVTTNCKFSLPCLPVSKFPSIEAGELPFSFELSPAELLALILKTRFAISMEETRYYLNGIFFHSSDEDGTKVLKTVATDGHRLGSIHIDAPAGSEDIPGVIIPRKTALELCKLLENVDETVSVSLSQNKIAFTIGDNATLISKLIDGTFPDYQKVIPQYNKNILKINRNTLAQAVDRVSTISSERSRVIKIKLADNVLQLSAKNDDSGTATEVVEVEYTGKELETGFNSRYLLEILAGLDGNDAEFAFADGTAPAIVKDPALPGALYVIMPMRI
jgi:DNA polymerase-3 subunit beta